MYDMIRVQPAPFVDQVTDDGQELYKLPYGYLVDREGMVQGQEFWQGSVHRVVGFQRDLARQQLDVNWAQVYDDPQKMVGLYLITADDENSFSVHNTAIASFEVVKASVEVAS